MVSIKVFLTEEKKTPDRDEIFFGERKTYIIYTLDVTS